MVRDQIAIRIPRPHLLPLHLRELLWEDRPSRNTILRAEAPTRRASLGHERACVTERAYSLAPSRDVGAPRSRGLISPRL